MSTVPINHAFVLPEVQFDAWQAALALYMQRYPNVTVVRGLRGADLNRFHSVSVVMHPAFNLRNGPFRQLLRMYPYIVRLDLIYAATPQAMLALLRARITGEDRFGSDQVNANHLLHKPEIRWPTTHRPARIVTPFHDTPGTGPLQEGIGILTTAGAGVVAAVAGTVSKVAGPDALDYGLYVQVSTQRDDVIYTLTYTDLQNVRVRVGEAVNAGDALGQAAGDSIRVVLQQAPGGMDGFKIPDVANLPQFLHIRGLRVRPTGNGLRVRAAPVDGEVLAAFNTNDTLEPVEPQYFTLLKLGVQDEWLRVHLPDGRIGFVAAWFLEAVLPRERTGGQRFADVNIVGVNLDQLHPLGTPPADRLGNIGWVRFGYNVSNNVGSEDIQAAYDRYAPLAERYTRAGYKVCFTTSHQTYGEGRNEFFPWPNMTDDKWDLLIGRFADMMSRIAQQWAGSGLAHCWQVWNEQDAHIGAVASVPMAAHNYAKMLQQVIGAMRASDPDVTVITGGHTSGPGAGSDYARRAIFSIPADVRPDGVAFHPYGRGVRGGEPYAIFGRIDDSMRAYGRVMPDRPVWITEWGVLDRGGDSPAQIADYALGMINYLKRQYPGDIAALIWYAWAESMHNGYGIVDANLNPREPLTSRFLNA